MYIERHMLTVEFTIEPFVEGDPGAHVTAAVAAVEAHGIAVDFGPFGSLFTAEEETLPMIVADLLKVAYSNGATFVNISVSRFES
ncbi:MAG: hypothetical protein JHD29_06320 [Ilumatobacteraceae bacterium]|nr:hypothetical protein [Ilumatobacteraceae bacterium]